MILFVYPRPQARKPAHLNARTLKTLEKHRNLSTLKSYRAHARTVPNYKRHLLYLSQNDVKLSFLHYFHDMLCSLVIVYLHIKTMIQRLIE